MERCKLGAFVTNLGKFNEGEIIGEWVNFPIKQEDFQKVLEKIGINVNYEEWFFSDYDTNLSGISDVLGEHANVDELNYLAARLQEMDSYDYEKFYAIVEDEMDLPQNGVPGLINLTFNMDKYDLFSTVFDEEDYGRYLIQESGRFDRWKIEDLLDYIDYEAYGRDTSINEAGCFTERGYVVDNQMHWYEEYDGTLESIPEEYHLSGAKESLIDAERDSVQKSKLKVLVVEPDKEPYVKFIEPGYRALQEEVDGTIQCTYPFADLVGIICNDDGKWMGMPLNRALRDDEGKVYDIVAGTFVIAGLTEDDFCSLDDDMIEKYTHMFKYPEMYIQVAGEIKALPVPDRTITNEQLMEYGHNPYGIAPLREKMAHKLLDTGLRVYNLIPGGGAERTQSHEDIVEHAEKGGYFAIEKGQWLMFVEKKTLEKVEELLEDDYNMIDGIINNGDKSKEDRSEKKTSVMEKLQEKKMEASMMEKAAPKQEKTKAIEIE
ncbi:MAG: antirestriction protein ArdA [Lachnospiraceae bacterium]|nr:antirestriction protein ArdA [Lachnospiraceae bacterium]